MSTSDINQQTIHQWMMAELDGETTPTQQEEIQRWIQADPALREEYGRLKQLRGLTMKTTLKQPPPALWDSYWQGVYRRLERGLGWILFSVGAIVLTAFGLWEMSQEWLSDSSIPIWVRIGGVSLALGLVILLVSVIREKIFLHKNERYKDIQR
ncbi:anti-sigma factor family protein [Pseudohongiella spirulinae]|uniref:Uncharacterized protein n=1 Tax=Pseudohongiella spirulinae TaxID=1249552 RepID=A0A0S2K9G5_9GAMM|nr:hypothetical protein [Pseudohongiella spirulinae]ALO44992.1 hypothetical protein PS2015_300 [Pseudohongiella spirulinae]